MELSPDGFFLDLWRENRRGERVYPCLFRPRGSAEAGLYVTLTADRDEYRSMSLQEFLDHMVKGDFVEGGRARMKPRSGGGAHGFALSTATMSSRLWEYISQRRGDG